MLRYLLFLLGLLSAISSFCQGTDERIFEEIRKKTQINSYYDSASVFRTGEEAIRLAKKLNDKGKEAEINILYGNHFYYSQRFERAKDYYNRAYYLAYSSNNEKVLRLARIRLTFILEAQGKSKEAETGFRSILKESKAAKDPDNTIECLNALAIMHERENKIQEATKLYLEGLKTAEENKRDYYTGVMLNNLGLLKLYNNETEAALADFNRALTLANKERNARLAGHIQNNLGLVFFRLNKTEEALSHYHSTLQYARMINHPKEMSVAFVNYSSALLQSKKPKEAIIYLDSALYVLEKNDMKYELSKAFLGKSEVLIEIGLYDEAISIARQARDLCVVTNNLEDLSFSHLVLHKAYEKKGMHELALKEYKAHRDLDDSLQNSRNNRMIKELQVQYDVEKKTNQLEQEKSRSLILEQENQLKKVRIRIIVSLSIVIVAALVIFLYMRNMRMMRKQQERFSQQLISNIEKERSRIARDLHDDIGQSLSAIKSRLTLMAIDGGGNVAPLEQEVGKVIEQTREISRSLYPSYLEKIGLTRSVARLMEIVQTSTHIECSFDICEEIETLPLEEKTHLYRIIQECINNTTKHSGASALKITIENSGEQFVFTYRDNGKGLGDIEESKGIGFLSINERARMLGGEMQVGDNSGKGFRLLIKFSKERKQKK